MSDFSDKFSLYPSTLFLPGDSFDTENHQLIGRRVAGASFAKGVTSFLEKNEELRIVVPSISDVEKLNNLLLPLLPKTSRLSIETGLNKISLSQINNLHLPSPDMTYGEIYRSKYNKNSFSITGIIHSICSNSIFQSIEDLIVKSFQPWDALICTSRSGRQSIEKALQDKYSYLENRFSLKINRDLHPQLPIIPLGVLDPFKGLNNKSRQDIRLNAREKLSLSKDSFLILSLGRISFHSKAHPLTLYRALARLTSLYPDKKICLIQCGSFFNSAIKEAYQEIEKSISPLEIITIGGLEPANDIDKKLALEAADVFVSPSDNIQETFGLTVIEAMAASLPTIVSDWNGYKDLVDNDRTGYLIPVSHINYDNSFLNEIDKEYMLGHISYDYMIGIRSMATVLDEEKMFLSLRELLIDPIKRIKMGDEARSRWKEHFSWNIIQKSYRELWIELSEIRSHFTDKSTSLCSYPDISKMFSHYGTRSFSKERFFCDRSTTPPEILESSMNSIFAKKIIGNNVSALVQHLREHKYIDKDKLKQLNIPFERHMIIFSMLSKFGIIKE